jgi:hypothetical protein
MTESASLAGLAASFTISEIETDNDDTPLASSTDSDSTLVV